LIGVESPLLTAIGIVGDLLIFWPACTGVHALASAAGNGGLAGAALTRRSLQALLTAVSLFVSVFAWNDPGQTLLFLLVIFAFVVEVLLLHLMWRAAAELPPMESGVPAGE
ncbi:MAG: hypothetical protein ACJ8J0_05710, partial [Longimicrobiaceae bacterium]